MLPKISNNARQKEPDKNSGNVIKEEIAAGNGKEPLFKLVGNEGMNNILNEPFDIRNDDGEDGDDLPGEGGLNGLGKAAGGAGGNQSKPNPKKIEDAKKQEEKIDKEDDPEKIIDIIPDDVADELVNQVVKANPKLAPDMVVEPPRRRKKGAKKPVDLEQAEDDMKPAEGFDFKPVKIPSRKKAGSSDRFLSGLAFYTGKTLGRLFGLVGNIIYWSGLGIGLHKLYLKLAGKVKNKRKIDPEQFQKTRRHDQIPGWGGMKFQKETEGERVANDPIKVDFRKIPGVWSQMIGAEAEDENGNPLKPVITVYVAEPDEVTDDLVSSNDIGHTYLGLEFSHFSKVTNRFERYVTKYGLFAPGGETKSSYMMGLYKNATVPGQLLNDADYGFTISQSFPAEPEQVNAIMKASETYADKGYRLFDRNCTTFVRDMVVELAHIRAAEHILAPEEIRLMNYMNAGMIAAIGFSPNARLGMYNTFRELGAQEDMSYERIGNKRFVKEEYDRYQASLKNSGSYIKYGMSPNSAAENMRRVKGPDTGMINALNYKGDINDTNKDGYSIQDLAAAYSADADKVNLEIKRITPENLMDAEKSPEEYQRIMLLFPTMMSPLCELADMAIAAKKKADDPVPMIYEVEAITPALLREKRGELVNNIKDLNTLLFKYYQNDQRLHLPIIHLIANLNRGINQIDAAYRLKTKERKNAGDLENAREEMGKKVLQIRVGGRRVSMTGSHYESYLQIFKTPERAVDQYARFQDLSRREDADEHLSNAEKRELAKLKRTEKLAKDFDTSHNYMLDKEGYRQQDIDYAFALGVKEKKGGAAGALFDNHRNASDVYKAGFLEKIFGGMKARINKSPEEGGMFAGHIGFEEMADWLDEDMNAAAVKKMNQLRMIIKGLKKTLGETDREKLYTAVVSMLSNSWFNFIFADTQPVSLAAPYGFSILMGKRDKKFPKLILKLIDMILTEDKGDSLIALRAAQPAG